MAIWPVSAWNEAKQLRVENAAALAKAQQEYYEYLRKQPYIPPPPTTEQRITNIERMLTELLDLLGAQNK